MNQLQGLWVDEDVVCTRQAGRGQQAMMGQSVLFGMCCNNAMSACSTSTTSLVVLVVMLCDTHTNFPQAGFKSDFRSQPKISPETDSAQ